MGRLTEREIFSKMAEGFALCAGYADKIAILPQTGPIYDKLRRELKLVEGTCRQAAYWRQDTRWLRIGMMMEEAHKRAGSWLRGIKKEVNGELVIVHYPRELFTKLADQLRGCEKIAIELRDKRPPKLGLILPETPSLGKLPHRDTRPVSTSGLILPPTVH